MKKLIHVLLFAVLASNVFAQTTIDNVKKFGRAAVTPIIQNAYNKGYMVRYTLDKVDRKNVLVNVLLFDENMSLQKEKQIVLGKKDVLLDLAYNGNTFLMVYFDGDNSKASKYNIEYVTYDSELKQLGKKEEIYENKEAMFFQSMIQNEEADKDNENFIFPWGDKGFVIYSQEKLGKKIETVVTCVDNNMKEKWKWHTDETNKLIETPMYGAGNANYHLLYLSQRKSVTASKFALEAILINAETGKVMYRKPLKEGKNLLNAAIVNIDDKGEAFMSGEYFEGEQMDSKSQNIGIFACNITPDGNFKNLKYNSWKEDIGKIVKVDQKGRMEGGERVFIHEAVKTADGKVYLVAEQYKQVISGAGMMMMAMSGGDMRNNNLTKISLRNTMIFTLGTDYKIEQVNIFEKLKHGVELPAGFDYVPAVTIARYLAYTGQFDFVDVQKDEDKKGFNVVSNIKAENEEGKKEFMVGTISLKSDGSFATDNISFQQKGSKAFVYTAKYGYLMIARFIKKEKKVVFGLEKINQ